MGACFGRCFNLKKTKTYRSQRTMYFQGDDNVEFDFLVDDLQGSPQQSKASKWCECSVPDLRPGTKQPTQEVVLELTDDTWQPRRSEHTESVSPRPHPSSSATIDVPLQPLDARSLLAARAMQQSSTQREKSITSSTPPSSLDLEWEHEGCLPIQPHHYAGVVEEDGCESGTTNGPNGASVAGGGLSSTGWSRVSTPDSLEWDPVEAPLATAAPEGQLQELDAETEQLLSEIERLTSRALRETGDWSS